LSEAQLAGIGYWLSGIGFVVMCNSFYTAIQGVILKLDPFLKTNTQCQIPNTHQLSFTQLRLQLVLLTGCFYTALAGMGGCPFLPGATGNIATEDTAHLMAAMGIATGIDISRVVPCSLRLENFLNTRFPGKIHHLPNPTNG
jgi:hypothetical protein